MISQIIVDDLCHDNKDMIDLSMITEAPEDDDFPIFIYRTDNGQNVMLKYVKRIGSGSFGKVEQYSDSSEKYTVALKTFTDQHDREIYIVKTLMNNGLLNVCKLVNARFISLRYGINAILMNFMSGSLSDILKDENEEPINISMHSALGILKSITEISVCLEKNGLYYSDFKLSNILYRCNMPTISVYYGDLGSLYYNDDTDNALYTFPPLEIYKNNRAKTSEKMVWGIAIIFVSLWNNIHAKNFITGISRQHKFKESELELFLNDIKADKVLLKEEWTTDSLITSMLSQDPSQRPSLSEVLNVLQ